MTACPEGGVQEQESSSWHGLHAPLRLPGHISSDQLIESRPGDQAVPLAAFDLSRERPVSEGHCRPGGEVILRDGVEVDGVLARVAGQASSGREVDVVAQPPGWCARRCLPARPLGSRIHSSQTLP